MTERLEIRVVVDSFLSPMAATQGDVVADVALSCRGAVLTVRRRTLRDGGLCDYGERQLVDEVVRRALGHRWRVLRSTGGNFLARAAEAAVRYGWLDSRDPRPAVGVAEDYGGATVRRAEFTVEVEAVADPEPAPGEFTAPTAGANAIVAVLRHPPPSGPFPTWASDAEVDHFLASARAAGAEVFVWREDGACVRAGSSVAVRRVEGGRAEWVAGVVALVGSAGDAADALASGRVGELEGWVLANWSRRGGGTLAGCRDLLRRLRAGVGL